ncbi:MAG: hypothetical protein RIQ89_495 [Bacteroidota bacterium]|jgi:8-oxo-dGTP pyrophosphatase MutT (NUDIX family)
MLIDNPIIFLGKVAIHFCESAITPKPIFDLQALLSNPIAVFNNLNKGGITRFNLPLGDFKKCWDDFNNNFKVIAAAGGLVINDRDQMLMIKRLGKWDLPKGKVEDHEKIELAAIREVREECGIQELTIKHPLMDTYHCYILGNTLVFKVTHWFAMTTQSRIVPTPQTEEDIALAEWVDIPTALNRFESNSYGNIMLVIKKFTSN